MAVDQGRNDCFLETTTYLIPRSTYCLLDACTAYCFLLYRVPHQAISSALRLPARKSRCSQPSSSAPSSFPHQPKSSRTNTNAGAASSVTASYSAAFLPCAITFPPPPTNLPVDRLHILCPPERQLHPHLSLHIRAARLIRHPHQPSIQLRNRLPPARQLP